MDRTEFVKVASWNVESIRAHHDQIIDWIDMHRPQVMCMQETKAGRRKFPVNEFHERGYEVIVHGGDNGRGGVAIASQLEISEVARGIPGAVSPLDEPRSIAATVEGIRLHTVYAPNGRKVGTQSHQIKLAWFTLLTALLESEHVHYPELVLAGDLNIAPLDLDVWEPQRYRKRNLTSPPERAAFDDLVEQAGLVDVVRDRFGDESVFTWWNRRSDFYETDRGWRLDHFLATPEVATRVTSVEIDRAERGRPRSTDHAPLLVSIEL